MVANNPPKFKTEGTSQTYGQLIIFPSKLDNGIKGGNDVLVNSPQATQVRLIPNLRSQLKISDIDDSERSKISIAAFSENKFPSVAIEQNLASPVLGVVSETPRQEIVNLAKTAENIENYAIVIGSAYKTKTELKKIVKDASAVDLFIMLKSLDSEEAEFNNLKVTELEANFTYNFFIPEEQDISSQEDQSKDPLLKNDIFNVPRYVKLAWKPSKVTEKLTTTEGTSANEKIKLPVVTGVVGYNSYTFKDSYEKILKKTPPIVNEGKIQEIVDLHQLDKAFDATVNKNVFTNTLDLVLSSIPSSLSINTIPILAQKPFK